MSVQYPSDGVTEPHTPDRVAIETPRGDVRVGDVVRSPIGPDGTRWFVVDVDGHSFRRRSSSVSVPDR